MNQTLTVPFEIKSLGDRQIEGHASIFGNVDLGGDIVLPGAFKKSLAKHRREGTMPLMFWMHRPDQVPGAWDEVSEDEKGLLVRGTLADTQLGNETRTLMKMKAVRGLSFGYRVMPGGADYDKEGNRLLKEIDIWECSPVSTAMNPLARIEAVKARLSATGEFVPTEREFEQFLRDHGYSRKFSEMAVSRIFNGDPIEQGDPVPSRGEPDADHWAAVLRAIERNDNALRST
jgi:HK97 family phage prohead protease